MTRAGADAPPPAPSAPRPSASKLPSPAPGPAPGTRPLIALGSTMTAQVLGSLCLAVPPVIAPVVAPELGFGAERVGWFIGLAYAAAMLSGLASGAGVRRFGAIGVTQWAMLLFAVGMALLPLGVGAALAASAVVTGIGYGLLNPSAAPLLQVHSPPRHRALYFSIKQASVPIGIALAGLTMPAALARVGWREAVFGLALLCLLHLVALFFARRPLDAATAVVTAPSPSVAVSAGPQRWALARVLREPTLRRVALASFAYAFGQLAYTTFLVSYLNLELGESLVLAAGILAVSQIASTLARIGWGAIADRWIEPDRLLGWLGIGSAIGFLMLGALGYVEARFGGVGIGWVAAASLLCAVTSMSWNGVYFAELARRTTPSTLASTAGAAQFLTFCGSTTGPVAFSQLLAAGASYGLAYGLVTILPLAAGLSLLRHSAPPPPLPGTAPPPPAPRPSAG